MLSGNAFSSLFCSSTTPICLCFAAILFQLCQQLFKEIHEVMQRNFCKLAILANCFLFCGLTFIILVWSHPITVHRSQFIGHSHQSIRSLIREAYNTRGIVKLNHGVKDNKMLCKKIFDKIDELEKKLKTSQTTTNESDEEDDDFPI
ncbi:hypothetical protein OUZ56_029795 [Daphnia magna]|uniref:Transmembrane protein n=1 Tax=Daphnia magna TaxID=35525 RepID=A0ABR0B7V3_9CRUS|nr:hypothetical protein OUZ56_029795 [Daphnia magna]